MSVSAVSPATVRRRYDRAMASSAASTASSETINSADVYRAVEGRLGSLSTYAVVSSAALLAKAYIIFLPDSLT